MIGFIIYNIINSAGDFGGLVVAGIVILGAAIIGLLISYNSSKKRIMRELKKSPAKPINSVKDNEVVRLHGKAKFLDLPLTAPLSGRKCMYYYVRVEQKGDKNSWRKIADEFERQDFYVQVGNELALVKQQATHRILHHLMADHESRSGWKQDANPKMEAFLAKHGKRSTTMLFDMNKTLRYKEAIIEEDEVIVVKGVAKWKALEQPIKGFSYSRILTLSSSQTEKLIITDDPKALKILPEKF